VREEGKRGNTVRAHRGGRGGARRGRRGSTGEEIVGDVRRPKQISMKKAMAAELLGSIPLACM
jgi:hypothetical protein